MLPEQPVLTAFSTVMFCVFLAALYTLNEGRVCILFIFMSLFLSGFPVYRKTVAVLSSCLVNEMSEWINE